MKVEQLYTGCLAEAAYYIESEGEAVIIDPLRETAPYLELAKERNSKIKYVLETHFHADFVSGHVDLANKANAQIVFGPNATAEYDFHVATDGEILEVGKVKIKVLHTPGHTMESTTYLLIDENGKNHAIFTGDTLFLGDVGRPDLAAKSELSKEDLAGHLFDSLRNKLMILEDDVIVYPGHGAGSACGKSMSKETVGTLGDQKLNNYALRSDMTKEEFITEVLDGMSTPPQYFPKNVLLNQKGYSPFDEVLSKSLKELSAIEVKQLQDKGVLILDVRHQDKFVVEHVANSLFIGLNGGFAPWVGELITDLSAPIVLITDEGQEEEAITRLSRVGYDNVSGYLAGGLSEWKKAGFKTASIRSIKADVFANELTNDAQIIDVRKSNEFSSEHVENAKLVTLATIKDNLNKIDNTKPFYIHCAGGYRSVIASSILMANGISNMANIEGGFDAILKENISTTDFVCPSTL